MSWTKGQIVQEAYAELALQGYVFDLSEEEIQTGVRRLDAMLAVWEMQGTRLGYPMPINPDDSDPKQDSKLPIGVMRPVFMNLAIDLAAGLGKTVTAETKRAAREGLAIIDTMAAYPQQQQLPATMPRGAGNRPWRFITQPFYPRPDLDPLQIGQGGDINVLPE